MIILSESGHWGCGFEHSPKLVSSTSEIDFFSHCYSTISEDLSVTRVKSEEQLLFPEGRQPDHLTTLNDQTLHPSQRPTHLTPSSLDTSPSLTPTPPDMPYQLPGHTPSRRLPTPPATTDPPPRRPNSVADFRHRRYRKLSTDIPKYVACNLSTPCSQ